MKRIIISIFIAVFTAGCSFISEDTLYDISSGTVIDSSIDAYDYSLCLNSEWIKTDGNDRYYQKYINDEDNTELYIFKNQDVNLNPEMKLAEIPSVIDDVISSCITNYVQRKINDHVNDYEGKFRFLHEYGQIDNQYYQSVYFLSDNTLPSVEGKTVPNCITVIYDKKKGLKKIDRFLVDIEKTIDYY